MPIFTRLNMVNDGRLFCMSNSGVGVPLQSVDLVSLDIVAGLVTLPEITYSHGLCKDDRYAFVGSWQDDCFIYRVPLDYNAGY